MWEMIAAWYNRHFNNPQVVILALLLILGFAVVLLMGDILLPLLAAIVVAYLLEVLVQRLERIGATRQIAAISVFFLFMLVMSFAVIELVPLVSNQVVQFVDELPRMVTRTQQAMLQLPEQFPNLISETQVREVMSVVRKELADIGQKVVTFSLSSLRGVITWLVYILLMIILVFFFLKDKAMIGAWVSRYLPRDRALVQQVWREMDMQIGNYIRGKIVEIIVIGVASYVAFELMGLNYAILLGLLVGLSVLVPFVGATVVTIPVALTAFFQWGWTPDFFYLILVYGIIQAIDGNVIVPLLFSEAVNLHPVAIIIAIIFFGGIWGFWGVFFAIPLATLVKAVLNAWPDVRREKEDSSS